MNSSDASIQIQRSSAGILSMRIREILGADALILERCPPLDCELLECSVAELKLYIPLSKARFLSFWRSFWNFAESLLQFGTPTISIKKWKDISCDTIYVLESAHPIGVLLLDSQPTFGAGSLQFCCEFSEWGEGKSSKLILIKLPAQLMSDQINQVIFAYGPLQRHFTIKALELNVAGQYFWREKMKMEIKIGSIDMSLEELLTLRPGDVIEVANKNTCLPCYLSCGDKTAFGGQLAISTPLKIYIESLILPQLSNLSSEAMRDFVSEEIKDDGE